MSKKLSYNCETGQEQEIQLTQNELEILQPIPTNEQLLAAIRLKRNRLLAECDWTQLNDIPTETKELWQPYRQALRDLPETVDVNNPIYPQKPT